MDYFSKHIQHERKDRWKSIIITFLATLLLFLVIFFYKFERILPVEEKVTTMLINFGNNEENATEESESKNENGAKSIQQNEVENIEPKVKEIPQSIEKLEPKLVKKEEKKPIAKEKVITGKSANKISEIKKETSKSEVKKEKKSSKKTNITKKEASAPTKSSTEKKEKGDGKGTATIGNLLKGRKQKTGSQETNTDRSNMGDPLGGESNGSSKIGVDRKLIAFIPGTMGQGGSQPSHNCSASGTITIAYTVDKAGNVVSANRVGGTSDACVVSTSISWVKRYVKAEKATVSSTGTYKITF